MIGVLNWVQTGEEMIREGSDRHISWVMDRQTWLGRGIDRCLVISQLYSIHLSRAGLGMQQGITKTCMHKHKC